MAARHEITLQRLELLRPHLEGKSQIFLGDFLNAWALTDGVDASKETSIAAAIALYNHLNVRRGASVYWADVSGAPAVHLRDICGITYRSSESMPAHDESCIADASISTLMWAHELQQLFVLHTDCSTVYVYNQNGLLIGRLHANVPPEGALGVHPIAGGGRGHISVTGSLTLPLPPQRSATRQPQSMDVATAVKPVNVITWTTKQQSISTAYRVAGVSTAFAGSLTDALNARREARGRWAKHILAKSGIAANLRPGERMRAAREVAEQRCRDSAVHSLAHGTTQLAGTLPSTELTVSLSDNIQLRVHDIVASRTRREAACRKMQFDRVVAHNVLAMHPAGISIAAAARIRQATAQDCATVCLPINLNHAKAAQDASACKQPEAAPIVSALSAVYDPGTQARVRDWGFRVASEPLHAHWSKLPMYDGDVGATNVLSALVPSTSSNRTELHTVSHTTRQDMLTTARPQTAPMRLPAVVGRQQTRLEHLAAPLNSRMKVCTGAQLAIAYCMPVDWKFANDGRRWQQISAGDVVHLLAVSSSDLFISLWRTQDFSWAGILHVVQRVDLLVWSTDANLLFSASRDVAGAHIVGWDVLRGVKRVALALPMGNASHSRVTCSLLDMGSRGVLLSGGADGRVHVWRYRSNDINIYKRSVGMSASTCLRGLHAPDLPTYAEEIAQHSASVAVRWIVGCDIVPNRLVTATATELCFHDIALGKLLARITHAAVDGAVLTALTITTLAPACVVTIDSHSTVRLYGFDTSTAAPGSILASHACYDVYSLPELPRGALTAIVSPAPHGHLLLAVRSRLLMLAPVLPQRDCACNGTLAGDSSVGGDGDRDFDPAALQPVIPIENIVDMAEDQFSCLHLILPGNTAPLRQICPTLGSAVADTADGGGASLIDEQSCARQTVITTVLQQAPTWTRPHSAVQVPATQQHCEAHSLALVKAATEYANAEVIKVRTSTIPTCNSDKIGDQCKMSTTDTLGIPILATRAIDFCLVHSLDSCDTPAPEITDSNEPNGLLFAIRRASIITGLPSSVEIDLTKRVLASVTRDLVQITPAMQSALISLHDKPPCAAFNAERYANFRLVHSTRVHQRTGDSRWVTAALTNAASVQLPSAAHLARRHVSDDDVHRIVTEATALVRRSCRSAMPAHGNKAVVHIRINTDVGLPSLATYDDSRDCNNVDIRKTDTYVRGDNAQEYDGRNACLQSAASSRHRKLLVKSTLRRRSATPATRTTTAADARGCRTQYFDLKCIEADTLLHHALSRGSDDDNDKFSSVQYCHRVTGDVYAGVANMRTVTVLTKTRAPLSQPRARIASAAAASQRNTSQFTDINATTTLGLVDRRRSCEARRFAPYTVQQILAFARMWRTLDASGTGSVDIDTALNSNFFASSSIKATKLVFSAIDVDGSGEVDVSELFRVVFPLADVNTRREAVRYVREVEARAAIKASSSL